MGDVLYGDVFMVAEVITLLLFIPVFYHMLQIYKNEKKWKYFTLSFVWLLLSTLAAIVREFYAFNTFRMLEWICITIGSFLLAYACYHSYKTFYRYTEESGVSVTPGVVKGD